MGVLKWVGFFRELEHGSPDGPSLLESRGALDESLRMKAADYLSKGAMLSTSGQLVDDWFDPAKTRIAPNNTLTDGVWYWLGDYSYYVRTYGVAVPKEFLDHMASQNWTPPKLSRVQLSALARAVVAEIRARS